MAAPPFFPVEKEPARLATSSPFPSRSAGRKPSLVDNVLPPTGARFLKASTGSAGPLSPSRRLTYVRNAPSATVEQEKPDTVRQSSDNPTTSGQINRGIIPPKAVESQLSSRRAGSQPPAPLGLRQRPSGAARAPSGHYSPMVMMPPGQNPWDRTRLVRQRLSVLGVVRCRPPKYPLTARHRRSLTLP